MIFTNGGKCFEQPSASQKFCISAGKPSRLKISLKWNVVVDSWEEPGLFEESREVEGEEIRTRPKSVCSSMITLHRREDGFAAEEGICL